MSWRPPAGPPATPPDRADPYDPRERDGRRVALWRGIRARLAAARRAQSYEAARLAGERDLGDQAHVMVTQVERYLQGRSRRRPPPDLGEVRDRPDEDS